MPLCLIVMVLPVVLVTEIAPRAGVQAAVGLTGGPLHVVATEVGLYTNTPVEIFTMLLFGALAMGASVSRVRIPITADEDRVPAHAGPTATVLNDAVTVKAATVNNRICVVRMGRDPSLTDRRPGAPCLPLDSGLSRRKWNRRACALANRGNSTRSLETPAGRLNNAAGSALGV